MKEFLSEVNDSTYQGGHTGRRHGITAPLVFTATIFVLALFVSTAVSACVAEGDEAMNDENYLEAIRQYEAHLKENPSDGDVMIKAARAYESANWWGGSVQWWDRYLERFPSGPQADIARRHAADGHRWIGSNTYIRGGSYRTAVNELNKAVTIDPELTDAYLWLAIIYQNEGMDAQAMSVLNRGLAAVPDDEDLLMMARDVRSHSFTRGDALLSYRKGIELYDRGDTPGALKRFRMAAESSPNFDDAHLWIARILFEQGRFAESIPEWQAAIDICSDNTHAAFYLNLARQKVKPELTMR